jgi:cyclophilin family peptidyl-prolyl cis-trans isomerase
LASEEDWIRGPSEAPVSLLVYGDFQSPNTVLLARQIMDLRERYPDQIQYAFRIYPLLPVNSKASLAGEAALSAGSRDHFWEMHDLLILGYEEWSDLTREDFIAWILAEAPGVDPDPEQLEKDLLSRTYEKDMQTAFTEAVEAGIPGVPLLLINRIPYKLTIDPLNLEAAIRLEILRAGQFGDYPPFSIEPNQKYYADFQLNTGTLTLQLFPESAPVAVNSFVFLAEQGWFDNTEFHKVIPGVLVEGGDPSGTGFGDAGYYFQSELDPAQRFDRAGMVGMISISPGIHSSRFFITLDAIPALDGNMTILGRVIRGMEYLEPLEARDPAVDLLQPAELIIESVTIEVTE